LGYGVGGWLGDRYPGASLLAWLLFPAGAFTGLIPNFAPRLIDAIILRHPEDQTVPLIWQKLDPALGSLLIFLLPCFVLATLPPFVIRLSARNVSHVGKVSGLIYAASTVGSIAGVFVSGYILIDYMNLTNIFRATGGLTILLGIICLILGKS
jgi:hypothetical protein